MSDETEAPLIVDRVAAYRAKRDAEYRAALGLEPDEPLPALLGNAAHNHGRSGQREGGPAGGSRRATRQRMVSS